MWLKNIPIMLVCFIASILAVVFLIIKMAWGFAVDWDKAIDDYITKDLERLRELKNAKEKQGTGKE